MAICIAMDNQGRFIQMAGVSLNDCTGFVMLDKADWVQYGLVQSLITIPDSQTFQAAWLAGFVTPMVIGLIAYCVGKVVAVWNQ